MRSRYQSWISPSTLVTVHTKIGPSIIWGEKLPTVNTTAFGKTTDATWTTWAATLAFGVCRRAGYLQLSSICIYPFRVAGSRQEFAVFHLLCSPFFLFTSVLSKLKIHSVCFFGDEHPRKSSDPLYQTASASTPSITTTSRIFKAVFQPTPLGPPELGRSNIRSISVPEASRSLEAAQV